MWMQLDPNARLTLEPADMVTAEEATGFVSSSLQLDPNARLTLEPAVHQLINVHNIMNATNPSTAEMLMHVLREGMTTSAGMVDVMPSFYESLESPAVAAYKAKQNAIIASHSSVSKPVALPAVGELEELTNANVEELTKNSKLLDFQAARESGRNSGRQTSGRAKTPRGWQGRAERMAKLRHAVAEIELGVRLAGKTCHKQADLEQAKSMRCLALISHNNMKVRMCRDCHRPRLSPMSMHSLVRGR